MSRARSLFSDTVVLAFGSLGGRILGILLLPLYTYCLTRAEFGSVDLIMASIDLVLPLLFLSVSEAVLRFAMAPNGRSGDVLRTAVTFVAGASVVTVLAAGLATIWWPPIHVTLIAAIIIVQACTVVLGAWGRAIGRVRTYAVSGVVQAFGVGCANLVFLLGLKLGVPGFLLSLLVGYLASGLVLLIRLPCASALRDASFDRALLGRMLMFSAPLIPNVILWWLTNISGRYFLAFSHGVDAVGIYGVASRFPVLVVIVTTVFAQAWQLAANRSADEDDTDRGQFYSDVFRFYAAVLILTVSAIVLLLKPLMRVAVTPDFYEAWQAVPPLLIGAVFAAFASFYGAIYTAARQPKGVFRTTLLAGLGSLILNSLLVPKLGVLGVGFSIALSFAGLWVLRVTDSQSITRTTVSARALVPGLLLLGFQISLQYTSLSPKLVYPLMAVVWLVLALLFRLEIREASRRVQGILKSS